MTTTVAAGLGHYVVNAPHAKNPQPKPEVPCLPTLRKVGNGYNITKSPPSSWVHLMTHRAKVPVPSRVFDYQSPSTLPFREFAHSPFCPTRR